MSPDLAPPPQNLDAEESVLGALMVSKSTHRAVFLTGLAADDFYRDRHRLIYTAIQRLSGQGDPVDVVSVVAELERTGQLDPAGGKDSVASLAARVPAPGSARHYAEVVLEHARSREIDAVAKSLQQSVVERQDIEESVTEAIRCLIKPLTSAGEPVEPEELAADFFDFLNSDEPVDVMELPWKPLNRFCAGGFKRQQVTVLTGPTGEGKSTVLDSMLESFHRQGFRCGIYATEMTSRERMARWLAKQTRIPYHRLILKQLGQRDHKRLLPWVNGQNLPPWSFRNAEHWSAQRIGQDILARGLDVAAIDPINLIPGANRTETMEEIAQELKVLALRARCHVISVAHLTKSASKFKERPTLGDIRQSGMIEANANHVMLLHRDRGENLVPKTTGWLGFLKARDGIPDGVPVEFQPGRYRFDAVDETKPAGEQEELEVEQPRSAITDPDEVVADPEDTLG